MFPPSWISQQTGFDIYGTRGCLPKSTANLLVSANQTLDDRLLDVTLQIPRGMSITNVIHDSLEMDVCQDLDKAVLLWDSKQQIPNVPFWVLNAVDDYFPGRVDFGVNADSHILPFPLQQASEVRIVEFFAGGYGGWHFAAKHIQKCIDFPVRVVGIDCDLASCRNYAISHQVPLVSAQSDLPPEFLHTFKSSCIYHADVFSQKWLPSITAWRPHIACISAPCQPWSDAGSTKGLLSEDGLAFTEVLGHCRFIQPQFLLLEQVEGFLRHPHKSWVLKTCLASGYVLIWSKVVDCQTICPTRRPRWIAILRHVDCPIRSEQLFRLPSINWKPNPIQFDAVLPTDLAYDDCLFLSDLTRNLLSDATMLPDHKRRLVNANASRTDILAVRCGSPTEVTPTFMASYGHQHRLAVSHLRLKGCLTHLLQPSQGPPRHWHPIEIFLMHLGLGCFFVDPDWELAYRVLGNQISTVHAIIPLVHVFNQLDQFCFELDLDSILQKAIDSRITVDNMIQIPFAGGHIVMRQEQSHEAFSFEAEKVVQEMIQHGIRPFPADSFWDLGGFQPLDSIVEDNDQLSPITLHEEVEVESVVSPTMAFVPLLPVCIKCTDGDYQYWIYADVTTDALVGLWDGAFDITVSDQGGFQLLPSEKSVTHPSQDLLVSMREGRITISSCCGDKIQTALLGYDSDVVFDQFGLISDCTKSFYAIFISTMPIQKGDVHVNWDSLKVAIDSCRICSSYNPSLDCIVLDFHGNEVACRQVKDLIMKSFAHQTLKILGRICRSVGAQLHFEPCKSTDAAPPSAFRIAAVVCLARLILDTMVVAHGRLVQFKWMNRVLWEGRLSPCTSLENLREVFNFVFVWIQSGESVSFVHQGKNIWNYYVADLNDRRSKGCLIYIIRGMHGGGSKMQHKVQIKNSLAGTLLEEGVDLQWITAHVEKLIDSVGMNKLIPVASLPAGHNRVKQIHDLFAGAGFPIPQPPKKAVQAPKALQTKARKQMPSCPAPSDVVIDCSYLLNEDDTHPKQIHEFRGHRTGVFLATAGDALPWLKEGQPLSADELGMIVMGDSHVATSLPQQAILLPCADCQGSHFLLSATLVQFGSKEIRIKPLDDQKISGGACKVTAVTLWQQDWSKEEWMAAISHSVQFVKEAFSFDVPDAIVSCWGRSLRKGRQIASNSEATSIQLHCSVEADQFNSFLSKSGFNRLWTTPKKQDGRISDDYRILWVPGELQHVTAVAAGLSGCAGLVRGKSSLGLRFAIASFDAAWKHVYPKEDVPEHIPATFVFKVEPLPFGCSPQQLEDWAKHVNWKCRPLRATGPCAWLVCAVDKPPQTTLAFNGSPLLVRLLPPRNSPSVRTIVAGPRQVAKATEDNSVINNVVPFDPWAQWKGPRLSPAAPSGAPKAQSGPTDQRIQQQDDRIAALETQIQNLHVGQTKQQHQIEQVGKELQQSEQRLANQVHKVVDEAKHDITNSLQTTLKQQQAQFEQSMQDIRQLLTSAAKRKSADMAREDMES